MKRQPQKISGSGVKLWRRLRAQRYDFSPLITASLKTASADANRCISIVHIVESCIRIIEMRFVHAKLSYRPEIYFASIPRGYIVGIMQSLLNVLLEVPVM